MRSGVRSLRCSHCSTRPLTAGESSRRGCPGAAFPRLLSYLVAIYLILAGLIGIGMLGRPLRAHVRSDEPIPVSAPAVGRPAPEVALAAVAPKGVHAPAPEAARYPAHDRQDRRLRPLDP